ncbi:MAG TPA: DUF4012 domain-containing protein [Candidatus Limnocylindrales bacterium]|nr:DUF4012 domain-containing protein [Candidatus Limnocylindrales bacterium]
MRRRVVVGLVTLAAVWLAADAIRLAVSLSAAREHLARAEAQLALLSPAAGTAGRSAASHVPHVPMEESRRSFAAAARELRLAAAIHARYQPLVEAARYVPFAGPRLAAESAAAALLLGAAAEGAEAGALALEGIAPLARSLDQPGAAPLDRALPAALSALRAGTPPLEAALARLDAATVRLGALDALSTGATPATLRRALPALSRVIPRLTQARQALDALVRLPDAMAGDPARPHVHRIALVSQKTAELRATGGFWGNVALLTLEDGRIASLDYLKSTETDNPHRPRVAPPAPLSRYMQIEQWMLRDANWWPDFPTSAAQLRAFVAEDLGPDFTPDTVIAFDEEALRRLVEALGGVDVADYAERLTAANAIERLEYHAYGPGTDASVRGRRPFFESFTEALATRLVSLPAERVPAVLTALTSLLGERHLLISATHPPLATLAAALAWDGRLDSSPGDYLYVVDTNVDYTEPFPRVDQAIDYEVTLEADGGATVLLTLSSHNTNPSRETLLYGRAIRRDLSDYLRVYVPHGARLIRATGFHSEAHTFDESGRTVFAGHFFLRAGDRTQVVLEYELPPTQPAPPDPRSSYHLTLQRQPGAPARPVTVTLRSARQPGPANAGAPPLPAWLVRPAALSASGPLPAAPTGTAPTGGAALLSRYRLSLETDLRLALPVQQRASGAAAWLSGLPLFSLASFSLPPAIVPAAPRPLRGAPIAPAPSDPASAPVAPALLPQTVAVVPAAGPSGPQSAAALPPTPPLAPAGSQAEGALPAGAAATSAPPPPVEPAATAAAPSAGPAAQAAAATPSSRPDPLALSRPIVPQPPAQRVRIEKLSVDSTVVAATHDGQAWAVPAGAVAWLSGTANPGERGNLVLTGLPASQAAALAPGDDVLVDSAAGLFRYRVGLPVATTSASDLTVLYPTRLPALTLIAPAGAPEQRLLVRAYLSAGEAGEGLGARG